MLDRFGDKADPRTANQVAWAAALGPGAVPDPARVVRLARAAAADRAGGPNPLPGRVNTLGAVLYRAGDVAAGIEQLELAKRLQADTRNATPAGAAYQAATDNLFLTLAYRAAGREADATRALDRAGAAVRQLADTAGPSGPSGVWNRLEMDLLHREAKGMAEK
jgi:hypothetical protein